MAESIKGRHEHERLKGNIVGGLWWKQVAQRQSSCTIWDFELLRAVYVYLTTDLKSRCKVGCPGMLDSTHIACTRDIVYVDLVNRYEGGEA